MVNETQLSMLARVQQTTVGESWSEFAHMYDGMIQGWLHRQGVQAQDADDIRQEVMTIVLRKIGEFEHSGRTGAFRAWLKTITSNCLRDFWKKKKRRAPGGPDLAEMAAQLEDESSRQSVMWNAEHDRYIIDHLLDQISRRLSEKSVTVFRRVSLKQEPIEAVAKDLGMTVGAVRVAQHRVLNALKDAGEGLIEC